MRRPMPTILGIICLVGLAGACNGSSAITDGQTTDDRLVDADCPGEEVPSDLTVTCHRLELEDASLSVIVLHAADPTGAPVLHLHGGPGGRAVLDRYRWLAPRSGILKGHDIILIDQRGGGGSTPSLDCPELDDKSVDGFDGYRACRQRLDDSGIDRNSTTVERIGSDMVALREAMELGSWHLHGVSFGTRIALELLRIDGGAVKSAVLDSPLPPEVDTYDDLPAGVLLALEILEAGCQKRDACPLGLLEPLRELLAGLADRAVAVTIRSGEAVHYDDVRFVRLVSDALANPVGPAVVRDAISLAAFDRLAEAVARLTEVASTGRSVGDPVSEGAQLSSECADEVPFNAMSATITGDPILDAVAGAGREVRALCDLWDVPASELVANRAVTSTVPILVLSGHLDPITPVAWARRLAGGLENVTLIESPRWTHVPSMSDPCAAYLVVRYLDGDQAVGLPDC